MAILITMVGVPGSGKSTIANKLNIPVVSTDAIREELFGSASVQTNGDKVFKLAYERIQEYLDKDQNVIFDAMSIKRKYRKDIIDRFNCTHMCIFMNTSLDECLKRNSERDRVVPEDVIINNYNKLCIPTEQEGYTKVLTINEGSGLDEEDLIMLDIIS